MRERLAKVEEEMVDSWWPAIPTKIGVHTRARSIVEHQHAAIRRKRKTPWRISTCPQSRKSRTQTVLFAKEAAILSPSRFQHTSKIPPAAARNERTIFPSLTDQTCRLWSTDPLARYSPFGLNEIEYTAALQ